jgi:hypothetical protein
MNAPRLTDEERAARRAARAAERARVVAEAEDAASWRLVARIPPLTGERLARVRALLYPAEEDL